MGFVLMLITIGGLAAAFILLIVALITKKKWLRNLVIIGVPLWLLLHFALLIGFSLNSQQTFLPNNRAKSFCGFYFGCHLKASVTNVRTAKEIGDAKAQNLFYIVKIKIENDSKDKTLSMTAPEATMIDEGPRLYSRIEAAEKQLPAGANISFNQPIPPGGSFEKEIVFDLTEPAKELNLSITDTHGINRLLEAFLIGDEESLLHKETLFIIKRDSASYPDDTSSKPNL